MEEENITKMVVEIAGWATPKQFLSNFTESMGLVEEKRRKNEIRH